MKTVKKNHGYAYAALLLWLGAFVGLGMIGCLTGSSPSATQPGQYSTTAVATAGGTSHSTAVTMTIPK
jgi:hypothetical protein